MSETASEWTLIFACDGSAEYFRVKGDPQTSAQMVRIANPWIRDYALIAAIEGNPVVLPADTARTAECGLQGWPH